MKKQRTRYTVQKARVIYGFPSTGKSEFASRQREATAYLVDTDDLFRVMFPKFWSITNDPLGRSSFSGRAGALSDAARYWVGLASRKILSRHPQAVILTNLWGAHFQRGLGYDEKLPLGFYRKSLADVLDVLTTRDGTKRADPKVVAMWQRSIKKYGPSTFEVFISLEEGEYLSDVLSMGPNFLNVADRPSVEENLTELRDLDPDFERYIPLLDSLLFGVVNRTSKSTSLSQNVSES